MATIKYCPTIENNIVELSINDTALFQEYYEKGYLIILKDFRIKSNFDFITRINVPAPNNKKKKYFLTHPKYRSMDCDREPVWKFFKYEVFKGNLMGYLYFYRIVFSVNRQIYDLCCMLFPNYKFTKMPITWKFQDVMGENLHIDNLEFTEKWPRLRVFANIGNSHRIWGLSSHLRHFAKKHLITHGLGKYCNSPYEFNMHLSEAAFGPSTHMAQIQEPRHYVYFEPGEVWFLNSALTAHQAVYGTRLVIGSFIHSYEEYKNESEILPNILKELLN